MLPPFAPVDLSRIVPDAVVPVPALMKDAPFMVMPSLESPLSASVLAVTDTLPVPVAAMLPVFVMVTASSAVMVTAPVVLVLTTPLMVRSEFVPSASSSMFAPLFPAPTPLASTPATPISPLTVSMVTRPPLPPAALPRVSMSPANVTSPPASMSNAPALATPVVVIVPVATLITFRSARMSI